MKLRIVAMVLAFVGLALAACSPADNGAHFVSSAHAASLADPMYPSLAADAEDGAVHEYY